jgi:hypothetical protein
MTFSSIFSYLEKPVPLNLAFFWTRPAEGRCAQDLWSGQMARAMTNLQLSINLKTAKAPPRRRGLLDRIESNGVRTVIVEDASRFARELVTQELGILALIKRGVRVLTANGDNLTDSSDPVTKDDAPDCRSFQRI